MAKHLPCRCAHAVGAYLRGGAAMTTSVRGYATGQSVVAEAAGQSEPALQPLPELPRPDCYSRESCDIRRQWVEQFTGTKLQVSGSWWPDDCNFNTQQLKGIIENPIGLATVPIATAGPMLFKGSHAQGWLLGPVATTEGALIASISRGAKAITMSGGVRTWATQQRMTRSPMFVCDDPEQAFTLGEWLRVNVPAVQQFISDSRGPDGGSSPAQLVDILPVYDADTCHVLLRFETGDEAGYASTQAVTAVITEWVRHTAAHQARVTVNYCCADGNLSSDKKVSKMNAVLGHGMSVTARAEIPENIMQRVLGISSHTITESVFRVHRISERTQHGAGMNVNVSNVLAGMFTALGQDVSCVHESAIARVDFVRRYGHPQGGIVASMYLPALVVGTVGGGTHLPTQRECLQMIGCSGEGTVRKLAEVIAGYCLALDLSTFSAVMGGHFAEAHDRLGRNRPDD